MKFSKLKSILVVSMAFGVSMDASAQVSTKQFQLMQNSELLNQLQNRVGDSAQPNFGSGIEQDSSVLFFNTFDPEYRLAPGDILRINLRGFTEVNESLKVTRGGQVILPTLPPIDVVGVTTSDLEQKILDLLRLGDASASAYVSLDTGRLVTVQVSGNVKSPRTVAVPAYTPLSRVLVYVGGVTDNGSL